MRIKNNIAIPQRNDQNIIEKLLENEIILYNKLNHNIHSLNKTAAILWELCDGTMNIREIIEFVLQNFKGDKELIENDIIKALDQMVKIDLIKIKEKG